MPSSTEPRTDSWLEAARDLGHLLRFRLATVRSRGAAVVGLLVVVGLTALFATTPARLQTEGEGDGARSLRIVIGALQGDLGPSLAGFLLLGIAAAVGNGGGRELLSRSEVAIHPVSPRTEHLGALVLTPLNLPWLVQVWGLIVFTGLLTPVGDVPAALLVLLLWICAATAMAQVVGWWVEGVRRTEHGVVAVRAGVTALAALGATLHLTGVLGDVARALPTTWVADRMVRGDWLPPASVLLVLTVVAVLAGGRPAARALRRPPREELRGESGVHEARPSPEARWRLDADLRLLARLDRGSVWRSVGMRRGLLVLGVGPGLVGLVVGVNWAIIILLPGLAVSGAALLFGVNAWCLDGKGMVWRETLPVEPRTVFDARALVLGESLLLVSGVPIVLGLLRNGVPDARSALLMVLTWMVVVVQVLAICMTWSVRSPYGVDLASPRATPAPHLMMAGYASRLSLTTTLTGVVFLLIGGGPWWLPTLLGVIFLTWSSVRLRRARRRWLAPPERARVVLTAAAV